MFKTKLLFTTTLLCYCFVIFGNTNNYSVEYITTREGLSHDNVLAIIQDSDGLLWFATQDGLNMYDGYNITVYKPHPNTGLNISFTSSIIEDKKQQLWLGTEGSGIVLFNKITKKFNALQLKADFDFEARRIKDMAMSDSIAWFAIDTDGLVTYDKTSKRLYIQKKLHKNLKRSSSLYLDKDILWIGTWGSGLFKHNIRTLKTEQVKFKDANNRKVAGKIWAIAPSNDNQLLVGAWGRGMINYDIKSGTSNPEFAIFDDGTHFFNGLIKSIVVRDNHFWAAGNKGISHIEYFSDSSFKTTKLIKDGTSSSINDQVAQALCFDRSGNLWCGTKNGGVNKIVFN
ncbi:MAG: hypothetical protein MI922_03615, partial [Bacteroidales bacterium]|nr:hypothetical protein [Bacteroidales bacterium]